jgi:winged helix DNA-binding protein
VVRSSLLRGTQHLVASADYTWLRPLLASTLTRLRQAAFGRVTAGVDLAELAAEGERLLAGRTPTRTQLREELAGRWPSAGPEALVWSVQLLVPVVHPPPNGTWRRGGATPFALATEWLDRPLETPDVARLVRRYLPASARRPCGTCRPGRA